MTKDLKDRNLARGGKTACGFGQPKGCTTIRSERRRGFLPNRATGWGTGGKSKRPIRASGVKSQALKALCAEGVAIVSAAVDVW
jgi:hypothetical protein